MVVFEPITEQERLITDKEYYNFSKIRGRLIKEQILENIYELKEMTPNEVRKQLIEYKKSATTQAELELFYPD